MTFPVNVKKYPVFSSYEDHLNSGDPMRVMYAGTDYATPVGVEVYATENQCVYQGYDPSGAIILIGVSDDGQRYWQYVHLSKILKCNRYVQEGELIAWSGATGYVTGPHTHIALIENGNRIDPDKYILDHQDNLDMDEIRKMFRNLEEQEQRNHDETMKYLSSMVKFERKFNVVEFPKNSGREIEVVMGWDNTAGLYVREVVFENGALKKQSKFKPIKTKKDQNVENWGVPSLEIVGDILVLRVTGTDEGKTWISTSSNGLDWADFVEQL